MNVTPTDPTQPDAQLAQKDREIAGLRAQLQQAQAERLALQTEVDALRNSTSWRLTGLVRAPRVIALATKRHYWNTQRQIAIRNGIGGAWRDMRAAWRSEGLGALARQVRYFLTDGKIRPAPGSQGRDRNDYMHWRAVAAARRVPPPLTQATPGRPLFSVVMPIYRPPLHLLREAVLSVQNQDFSDWELCLADDASQDAELSAYLSQIAQEDLRIKVTVRPKNGHISAASNSALELATGHYVVLLDQDDVLAVDALAVVAHAVIAQPDVKVVFSDEDRMNEEGTEWFAPYFKPDFNYDLLLAQNMISHLGVFDRELMLEIGGFRLGLEGSQDHDLALRAMERIARDQILHIPRVLYHWRAIKGSAALDNSEKGYASTAARQAVIDHIARTGQRAEVTVHPDLRMFNRVRYDLPQDASVDVIVNNAETLASNVAMIEAMWLARGGTACHFLLCVSGDTVAAQQTVNQLKKPEVSAITVVEGGDAHWATTLNRALGRCASPFVAVVGASFKFFSTGWLEELVRCAAQERVGLVSPRVRCEAGLIDHGGIVFCGGHTARHAFKGLLKGWYGPSGRAILTQEFQALSPVVFLARRSCLLDQGGWSIEWGRSAMVTHLDKCMRLNTHGVHHIWLPFADLVYEKPRYAGRLDVWNDDLIEPEHVQRWYRQWSGKMSENAYNPNLSAWGDFSLNWQALS